MACSMAKCFAADVAVTQTSNAVQIFGGNGLSREYPVEKLFRDARAALIEDGADPERPTGEDLAPYDQFHGRGLDEGGPHLPEPDPDRAAGAGATRLHC